jgi:hypothetical protein
MERVMRHLYLRALIEERMGPSPIGTQSIAPCPGEIFGLVQACCTMRLRDLTVPSAE